MQTAAPSPSEPNHNHIIGGNIQRVRLAKDLTLAELSEATGCPEAVLADYESGSATALASDIYRIACALKTPIPVFIDTGTALDNTH